jgi:hypothetical protein
LFAFRPYTGDVVYINGESSYPKKWIKVRSWIWPGLLTNAAKVGVMCSGSETDPCWDPRAKDLSGTTKSKNLQLVRDAGQWRYRVLTPFGEPFEGGGGFGSADFPPRRVNYSGYYRLTVGIVSDSGLAYWALTALLGSLALARTRRRRVAVSET